MTCGELVAVAEDGAQRFRDGAGCRLASGEVLVDAEALQRAMQPLGLSRIGMAVGNKGAVFERDGLGHGLIDPDPLSPMALLNALSVGATPAATNELVTVR